MFINIPDTNFFEEDILNKAGVTAIINKIRPNIIIHLAAIHFIPYCNEHPYDSSDINIRGTMHILDAAKNAGVEKVLFASTAAVYPIYDEAVSEKHEVGPLDIYGLSKLTCERLCNEFHLVTKIPR